MDQLEFEYPKDFVKEEEVEPTPQLPPFKASSILYVTGAIVLFLGVMTPLLEMMARPGIRPDTIIEMLEWNPFSQIGLVGITNGLFLFWLGLMSDKRGA